MAKLSELRAVIDAGGVVECFIKNPVSGVSERHIVYLEVWNPMYILKIFHAPRPGEERGAVSEIPQHNWYDISEGIGKIQPDGWKEVS